MAYAFSQIMGEMGQAPEGEDQQLKRPIESQQQVEEPRSDRPQSAQEVWQQQREGDKRAYEAAAKRSQTPAAVGSVGQQIQQNQQNLQNQANQYVAAGKANQTYGVGNNAIKNAVGGNQVAFGRVNRLLNQGIKDVGEFEAPDVTIGDANLLGTDAGLRSLVGRGQGPQYTQGMGDFDVRALHMTPGFDREVAGVRERYQGLLDEADETGDRARREVTDYGERELAAAKKKVTDALLGKKSSLESGIAKKASDYNAEKGKIDIKAQRGTAKKEAAARAKKDLGGAVKNIGQFLPKDIDARQFVKAGADLNGDAFITEREANQFNNVLALMGTGGKTWSAAERPIDPSKNFMVDQVGLDAEIRRRAMENRNAYKPPRAIPNKSGPFDRRPLDEPGQIWEGAQLAPEFEEFNPPVDEQGLLPESDFLPYQHMPQIEGQMGRFIKEQVLPQDLKDLGNGIGRAIRSPLLPIARGVERAGDRPIREIARPIRQIGKPLSDVVEKPARLLAKPIANVARAAVEEPPKAWKKVKKLFR